MFTALQEALMALDMGATHVNRPRAEHTMLGQAVWLDGDQAFLVRPYQLSDGASEVSIDGASLLTTVTGPAVKLWREFAAAVHRVEEEASSVRVTHGVMRCPTRTKR